MKKTFRFIGVLFAAVVVLWVYNSVNEIRTHQPQPAAKAVSNPEPTVSAPATGNIIVVTGNVTPVYKQ